MIKPRNLPKEIEVLLMELVADVYQYVATHDITINNSYEVVCLAGYSVEGKTIYIDCRLPRWLVLKDGRKIDLYKYLIIHEIGEKILEDAMGYKYPYAHEFSTGSLERKAVENDNIDWDVYQDFMLKEVQKLKKFSEAPPDIDTKPEKDTHDYYLLHKVEKLKHRAVGFIEQVHATYRVVKIKGNSTFKMLNAWIFGNPRPLINSYKKGEWTPSGVSPRTLYRAIVVDDVTDLKESPEILESWSKSEDSALSFVTLERGTENKKLVLLLEKTVPADEQIIDMSETDVNDVYAHENEIICTGQKVNASNIIKTFHMNAGKLTRI